MSRDIRRPEQENGNPLTRKRFYKQGIISLIEGIEQESALEFYYALIMITSNDTETMKALEAAGVNM